MSQECFFFGESSLLCNDICRDGDEIRGDVINGRWYMVYTPGRLRAYQSVEHYSRRPNTPHADLNIVLTRSVKIPTGVRGDYNDLINWATNQ